jgi:hyperosmotically inducible periplasmic protein
MFSKVVRVALSSYVVLALLATLNGCQYISGKTVSQTMKDASITTAVQTELTSDRLSNMSRIDVNTERGVVNLSGVVETEGQRVRAERLAYHVEGVVQVNNNLQIQNRLPSEKQPNPAHAQEDTKASQPQRSKTQEVNIIQGDVLRVEYDNLIIQRSDGHEVHLQFDENTEMTGYIGPGEHIEAKVNEQKHALSVRQLQ